MIKHRHNELSKSSNAHSGVKAHNDNQDIKIGRIRLNSWANKVLKAYNIYVSETTLVHIDKMHRKDILRAGMTPFDFVKFITTNFNEVRQGSNGCFLLIVRRQTISNWAAIEVSYQDRCYKIKTASLINNSQLDKKPLIVSDHVL